MIHILIDLSRPGQGVEKDYTPCVERLKASTDEVEGVLKRVVDGRHQLLGYLAEVYSVRAQQERFERGEIGQHISPHEFHSASANCQ